MAAKMVRPIAKAFIARCHGDNKEASPDRGVCGYSGLLLVAVFQRFGGFCILHPAVLLHGFKQPFILLYEQPLAAIA